MINQVHAAFVSKRLRERPEMVSSEAFAREIVGTGRRRTAV